MLTKPVIDGTGFRPAGEDPLLSVRPEVSFVVPTFNNEETIEPSLRSIRDQSYGNIEIVLVDKMSSDATVGIGKKYADKVVFDDGTYGSACQTGFEVSKGEIIVMWDDDTTIPDKEWLVKSIRYFQVSPRASTLVPLNVSPDDASSLCKLYFSFWRAIVRHRVQRGILVPGRIHLRRCVEEVGGFDRRIHWGADMDLSKKLVRAGYLHVYYEEPIVHRTMLTLREYVRKQIYGARAMNDVLGAPVGYMLYEHVVVGPKAALVELSRNRKEWLLFPLLFLIRLLTYGVALARSLMGSGLLKSSSGSRRH